MDLTDKTDEELQGFIDRAIMEKKRRREIASINIKSQLFVGAKVRIVSSSNKSHWTNGKIGTVTKVKQKKCLVTLDNIEHNARWDMPMTMLEVVTS